MEGFGRFSEGALVTSKFDLCMSQLYFLWCMLEVVLIWISDLKGLLFSNLKSLKCWTVLSIVAGSYSFQ
jgi:hypothetical protein